MSLFIYLTYKDTDSWIQNLTQLITIFRYHMPLHRLCCEAKNCLALHINGGRIYDQTNPLTSPFKRLFNKDLQDTEDAFCKLMLNDDQPTTGESVTWDKPLVCT